jgi:hypothetical protein
VGLRDPYRPPKPHTRRARHWRRIEFGERLINKHGVLTDWEALSPPYRNVWEILCRIDVACLACGKVYVRYLNDLLQGKSHRCIECYRAGRKAPQAGGRKEKIRPAQGDRTGR